MVLRLYTVVVETAPAAPGKLEWQDETLRVLAGSPEHAERIAKARVANRGSLSRHVVYVHLEPI